MSIGVGEEGKGKRPSVMLRAIDYLTRLTGETLRREEDVRARSDLAAFAKHLFGSLVSDVIVV